MNANRLATRFEIAVANFVRSSFDLQANEKACEADHSDRLDVLNGDLGYVIFADPLRPRPRDAHRWARP